MEATRSPASRMKDQAFPHVLIMAGGLPVNICVHISSSSLTRASSAWLLFLKTPSPQKGRSLLAPMTATLCKLQRLPTVIRRGQKSRLVETALTEGSWELRWILMISLPVPMSCCLPFFFRKQQNTGKILRNWTSLVQILGGLERCRRNRVSSLSLQFCYFPLFPPMLACSIMLSLCIKSREMGTIIRQHFLHRSIPPWHLFTPSGNPHPTLFLVASSAPLASFKMNHR